MAKIKIAADGTSSITQYVTLLLQQRDLLERAIKEDAEALRILSAPALNEAVAFVERGYWGAKIGREEKWLWDEVDENRLNWMRCLVGGAYPACRVARLLARFEYESGFRRALDESRRDNTADFVGPLLVAAKDAHASLLAEAREISEWESLPLPSQFDEAILVFNEAVSSLIDIAPHPHAQKPLPREQENPFPDAIDGRALTKQSRKIKPFAETVRKIRLIQDGKTNDEVVAATGCSAETVRKVRCQMKANRYVI